MTDIARLAKERADKFGVRNVIVATSSGASAEMVHESFGPGYQVCAVGNPASAHERGLIVGEGISRETQERLERKGIRVALQDQSLFQGMDKCFGKVSLSKVMDNLDPSGNFNAVAMIYRTLQLFGNGPRVCIEIAMLAADSGVLPLDADCISIARPSTWCAMPDAAVVLRPARTQDIFKGQLRIKDLVLSPPSNDLWFSNSEVPW